MVGILDSQNDAIIALRKEEENGSQPLKKSQIIFENNQSKKLFDFSLLDDESVQIEQKINEPCFIELKSYNQEQNQQLDRISETIGLAQQNQRKEYKTLKQILFKDNIKHGAQNKVEVY